MVAYLRLPVSPQSLFGSVQIGETGVSGSAKLTGPDSDIKRLRCRQDLRRLGRVGKVEDVVGAMEESHGRGQCARRQSETNGRGREAVTKRKEKKHKKKARIRQPAECAFDGSPSLLPIHRSKALEAGGGGDSPGAQLRQQDANLIVGRRDLLRERRVRCQQARVRVGKPDAEIRGVAAGSTRRGPVDADRVVRVPCDARVWVEDRDGGWRKPREGPKASRRGGGRMRRNGRRSGPPRADRGKMIRGQARDEHEREKKKKKGGGKVEARWSAQMCLPTSMECGLLLLPSIFIPVHARLTSRLAGHHQRYEEELGHHHHRRRRGAGKGSHASRMCLLRARKKGVLEMTQE